MTTGSHTAGAAPPRRTYGFPYEDFLGQFYGSLVSLGIPTRSGLGEAGYADHDIDIGVAELMSRGFLSATDDPDTWQVNPPRAAFTAYAVEMEHRLNLAKAMLGPMELMWRRSVGRQRARELPPEIDLLVDAEDIAHRVQTAHETATTRLWWAVDGSRAARSLLDRVLGQPGLLDVRPGVERRLMIDTSLLQDEAALTHLHRSTQAGHQVRVGNGIPFALLIADDTGLVDLSGYDELGQGSFETRMTPTVAALSRLSDEIFTLCTPYGDTVAPLAPEGAGPPLDERDRRILSLLTVGASDQVVARQLDVSVRTVERRVRYIMEHLGAATRFQAGVQAVRRGWA